MDTLYRRVFVDIWPWWVGGPAIGLYVILLLLVKHRLLSASSTFQYVVERVIRPWFGRRESITDWLLADPGDPEPDWLGRYFVGLLLGGLASALLSGTFAPDATLPGLALVYPYALATQVGVLFVAGLAIGFGTRMSGGCTSGHCIVGVSALQPPSMAATAVFFGAGIAASFAAEWVARGAGA